MLDCGLLLYGPPALPRRHMYLESKLPQLQPQGAMHGGTHPALGGALRAVNPYGRLALPPCLSDRAKEVSWHVQHP